MLKFCSKNKKGFSLLELLVVILIIGVLAAIALPQYQMAVYKARFSTLMNSTNAIYDAEERFYMIWGRYTPDLSQLDISLEGCELSEDKSYCIYDWGVCEVVTYPTLEKATCLNTTSLQNAYSRYFITHSKGLKRVCYSLDVNHEDINNKYNKVCKEFGGKLDYADGGLYLSSGSRRSSCWSL